MARRKSRDGRVLPDGVSERADGRFIYRYQVYGKPHYIYDKDLCELKKKILQSKIDVANGVCTDVSKLKLGEWYFQYIDIYKRNKVKQSTLFNYENYYKWYVKDSVIDRMPIKDLKRTHIVAHFQYLAEKKNLAHGTLRSLASMLFNCLQQGVYDGVITLNPAVKIMDDVRATPKEIREALSVEETQVLIEFLKREGEWQNIYLPAFAIGLSTGLRFGELFGLTWRDVDFKNKVIDINHSINYRDRGNGHEYFVTSPKTKNAYRQFPMTEEVAELFRMQKRYQNDMRIRQDIKIDGYSQFVFTAKTGVPFTHESIVRTLKNVIKQANEWERKRAEEENRSPIVIPIHTPHVWRHTLTTRLVEKQIPYERLKVLMGHSSIKTTIDIYTHITQSNLKEVRTDLDGIINVL